LASRNASFHEAGFTGALLAPLKLVFALTLTFVGITLVAWIVDWTFVFKVWPDGIDRLKIILAADLTRALDLAEWQGGVPSAVTGTANFLYALVFRFTGIHDMGMRFAEGAALSIPDTIVRNTYIANRDAIEVAMIGTQLLGVRLATLAMMVPLLALIYLVSAADGLTQRAIRRVSGGRESASLYHRAKHLQVVLVVMAGALSLIQPVSIDPRMIWVPAAAFLGILARLQWACYKKHL
jgi:integrating conjugative element membrane protein (TIGR03747 family)